MMSVYKPARPRLAASPRKWQGRGEELGRGLLEPKASESHSNHRNPGFSVARWVEANFLSLHHGGRGGERELTPGEMNRGQLPKSNISPHCGLALGKTEPRPEGKQVSFPDSGRARQLLRYGDFAREEGT